MKKIKSSGWKDYDEVTFSWELTDECQYRCSYCYVRDILKKQLDPGDERLYEGVLKQLKLKSAPQFRMEILGGEPTTHPHFLNVIHDLESNIKCKYLSVNTNFVKPLEFFSQFCNDRYKKLEFSISVHIEYVSKRLDEFIDKIISFSSMNNIRSFVNMNLHKDAKFIPDYEKLVNVLTDNNIAIGANYLFSTNHYNSEYTQEFYEDMISKVITPTKYKTRTDIYIDYEKYPYMFDDGTEVHVDLHEINKNGLKSFKGFNCRPKLWYIHKSGICENACTGETLDMFFKNVNKCVECPCDSCSCDFMLNYHKTAPGEQPPLM